MFPWLAGCPALGDVGGDHAKSFRVGREAMLISLHVCAHCPDVALVFLCYQLGTWLDEELNP